MPCMNGCLIAAQEDTEEKTPYLIKIASIWAYNEFLYFSW